MKLGRVAPETKKYFLQGDCENTGFPDNSIDVILCSEMLHHLDFALRFSGIASYFEGRRVYSLLRGSWAQPHYSMVSERLISG